MFDSSKPMAYLLHQHKFITFWVFGPCALNKYSNDCRPVQESRQTNVYIYTES